MGATCSLLLSMNNKRLLHQSRPQGTLPPAGRVPGGTHLPRRMAPGEAATFYALRFSIAKAVKLW